MAARLIAPFDRRQAVLVGLGAAIGGVGVFAWTIAGRERSDGDVRAFGAQGDARHDDTKALQQAIDKGGDILWFPSGRYRVTAPLRPRSGQAWRGEGASVSVIVYDGVPTAAPFNLVQASPDAPLEAFSMDGLGFLGGRSRQLISSQSGQDGFALYLRTELRSITIRNCRFEHFGDGRGGGGGIVLGPRPQQAVAGPVDILVEGCVFADNGNVPGLYICTGGAAAPGASGIRIQGNSFGGSVGSVKVQNAVYVLGSGPNTVIRHVDVSHNRFDFSSAVDVGVELNWVETFVVSGNTLHFHAAIKDSAAILVRDGCADGVINGNIITSSSEEETLRGIVVLNFRHPGHIRNLMIVGNVVSGFAGAIVADRGSNGVIIADNRISGRGDGSGFGIRVVDVAGVQVSGNMISAMGRAVLLGHGDQPESALRDVVVERNRFLGCGGGGLALISAELPATGLVAEGLVIRDNIASGTSQGSPAMDASLIPPQSPS
jgi:hypothetical protein